MPGAGRPFQKGKSGNPGGTPSWVKEMRELAGARSKEALETLAELMNSDNPHVAIAACIAILDRAGLKPFGYEAERVEVTSSEELLPEVIMRRLQERLLAKVAKAEATATPPAPANVGPG